MCEAVLPIVLTLILSGNNGALSTSEQWSFRRSESRRQCLLRSSLSSKISNCNSARNTKPSGCTIQKNSSHLSKKNNSSRGSAKLSRPLSCIARLTMVMIRYRSIKKNRLRNPMQKKAMSSWCSNMLWSRENCSLHSSTSLLTRCLIATRSQMERRSPTRRSWLVQQWQAICRWRIATRASISMTVISLPSSFLKRKSRPHQLMFREYWAIFRRRASHTTESTTRACSARICVQWILMTLMIPEASTSLKRRIST